MPAISVNLVAKLNFTLYRKKCCMILFYNFSSKGCSFDQNTYLLLGNLVFSFFSKLVRAILEQNTIPPLDRKKMKKIRVDRLPSARIFTTGWNQFYWRDLILCSYQFWYTCNKIWNGYLHIVCQFKWSVIVTLNFLTFWSIYLLVLFI